MRFSLTRRKFIKYSGALTIGLAATPNTVFSKPGVLFRFGIVTDSHYADRDPLRSRYFRDSLPKLEEAIGALNEMNVDFVVHLGDFKDEAEHPEESSTLSFLMEIEKVFSGFNGARYHVVGNHDVDSISKEQFLSHIENTGIDKNRSYYSFDHKGIHFIILDGDFKKDGTPYHKGNFDWKESFIPDTQLTWLQNDLSQTSLPTIVFVHQLLDNVNDLDYCIANASDVRRILNESERVLAVFQGHRHAIRYNRIEHIHYCTLPAMVDFSGLDNNSFSVVGVYANGDIEMKGFKRAPSRTLKS